MAWFNLENVSYVVILPCVHFIYHNLLLITLHIVMSLSISNSCLKLVRITILSILRQTIIVLTIKINVMY